MFTQKSTEFLKEYGSLPMQVCNDCKKEVLNLYTSRWASNVCGECNALVALKVQKVMETMQNDKGYIISGTRYEGFDTPPLR